MNLAAAAWAVILIALAVAVLVSEWWEQRRVDRLNAENQAEYQAALAEAKRLGTRPPMPPNVWRRG